MYRLIYTLYKKCWLGQQRPSAIPQSQNNASFPCLILLCIPYLGVWRRDSWYSGKYSICRFSFIICLLSLFRLTDQYLPPYLFQVFFFATTKTLQKSEMSNRWRDSTLLLIIGWGWYGRAANLLFLPVKVQTFWVQASGFTLEATRQVGPTLAWERTRCSCLSLSLGLGLLCFLAVI